MPTSMHCVIRKMRVENVGRFKSLATDGDSQYFRLNTFIYGRNTHGKSTLTAIFHSLLMGNPDFIIGRKTIGTSGQAVKLTVEEGGSTSDYRYTTHEGRWNSNFGNMLLFDNNFVKESVYTQNQQIGQDQQRSIEAFMLGSNGVERLKRIDAIGADIQANATTQTRIQGEYSTNKHLLGGMSFEAFLDLEAIPNVENEVVEVQAEIKRLQNAKLISDKLASLISALAPVRDFSQEKISIGLSIRQELIESHYESHVNASVPVRVFNDFLQSGSRLRRRENPEFCPFCTQELNQDSIKEFINTIDMVFDEHYKRLLQDVVEAGEIFSADKIATLVRSTKQELQQLGFELQGDESSLVTELGNVEILIHDKREDLSRTLNSQDFANLMTEISEFESKVISSIALFESPELLIRTLSVRLNVLKASIERFGAWSRKCDAFLIAKKTNEDLSDERARLRDDYLQYASLLSATAMTEINRILRACNCNFSLRQFAFRGNQRRNLFVLSMGGVDILNDGNDDLLTIKNSLSDSDKWILALAFFLASVKNDQNVKVVIFDDPVSSFDVDRKRTIMKEIRNVLEGSGKQLILLTHEQGFFSLLHKEYSSSSSSVFLRFEFDSENGSNLVVCDPLIDYDFISEYRRQIAQMRQGLVSDALPEVVQGHSCIRPAIEHILKTKYPLELGKEHITIEKMLSQLELSGGPYEFSSPRNQIADLLPNLVHHDNSGVAAFPSAEIGIDDYKNEIREAFQVLRVL